VFFEGTKVDEFIGVGQFLELWNRLQLHFVEIENLSQFRSLGGSLLGRGTSSGLLSLAGSLLFRRQGHARWTGLVAGGVPSTATVVAVTVIVAITIPIAVMPATLLLGMA